MTIPNLGHFLRDWRTHRGLTLEQVGEMVGMSHQNLGKIERGAVPYSQGLLERLSEIYGAHPGELLLRGPDGDSVFATYSRLSPDARRRLFEIAKVFEQESAA